MFGDVGGVVRPYRARDFIVDIPGALPRAVMGRAFGPEKWVGIIGRASVQDCEDIPLATPSRWSKATAPLSHSKFRPQVERFLECESEAVAFTHKSGKREPLGTGGI